MCFKACLKLKTKLNIPRNCEVGFHIFLVFWTFFMRCQRTYTHLSNVNLFHADTTIGLVWLLATFKPVVWLKPFMLKWTLFIGNFPHRDGKLKGRSHLYRFSDVIHMKICTQVYSYRQHFRTPINSRQFVLPNSLRYILSNNVFYNNFSC